MKGITNSRPGASVRSYLPSRSTTQACCCGTILKVWKMKIATTTKRTSATLVEKEGSMRVSVSVRGEARGEDEPVAFDGGDDVLARDGRGARQQACRPRRAAIAHLRRVVAGPHADVDALADVEVDVAVLRR